MVILSKTEQKLILFGCFEIYIRKFGFKDQNVCKTRSAFYKAMKRLVEEGIYSVKKIKILNSKTTYENCYTLTFKGEKIAYVLSD